MDPLGFSDDDASSGCVFGRDAGWYSTYGAATSGQCSVGYRSANRTGDWLGISTVKPVAESWNRDDETRALRIVFDFVTQAQNVHVDGSSQRGAAIPPHVLQQRISGNCFPTVFHKIPEKPRFKLGQFDDGAVSGQFRLSKVDANRSEFIAFNVAFSHPAHSHQQCFNAGLQFVKIDWFQ